MSNTASDIFGGPPSFILLAVIFVVWLLSKLCFTCFRRYTVRRIDLDPPHSDAERSTQEGLDASALKKYPKLLYCQAKTKLKGPDSSLPDTCSICLSQYKSSDRIRLLPQCGHFYHRACIDPWLRQHHTCPVCRKSLVSVSAEEPPLDSVV